MNKEGNREKRRGRRTYSDDLKAEAVQILLDGHNPASVAKNVGLKWPSLLHRWKEQLLANSGPAAYIRYYNTRRRHSALDYLTPEEFEAGSR